MANPRILIVTPEVTYLPDRMKSMANYLTAKAGGLAGGILGAWLGRTERWDEVDLERERSARREALDRCAAVRRTDPAGPMPMLDCQ